MDKYKRLIDVLKQAVGGNNNIPLIIGTVLSNQADSCTISHGATDEADPLELSDVRLKATIGNDDNYLIVFPKIGSSVVCGSITGDYEDLCVLKVDEIDHIEIVQNGLNIMIDANDQRVSVKNGTVGLYDLFASLGSILQNLKVYTPVGPSGTPLPDTIVAVQQFETDFKSLLK